VTLAQTLNEAIIHRTHMKTKMRLQ